MMEEIDRFQVPTAHSEVQPLVRGRVAGSLAPEAVVEGAESRDRRFSGEQGPRDANRVGGPPGMHGGLGTGGGGRWAAGASPQTQARSERRRRGAPNGVHKGARPLSGGPRTAAVGCSSGRPAGLSWAWAGFGGLRRSGILRSTGPCGAANWLEAKGESLWPGWGGHAGPRGALRARIGVGRGASCCSLMEELAGGGGGHRVPLAGVRGASATARMEHRRRGGGS